MASTASLSFAASLGAPATSRRAVRSRARSRVVRASVEIEPGSDPAPDASPAPAQIVVFGSNGKTGARCVQYAARAGIPVTACTRSGSWSPQNINLTSDERSLVTAAAGDVAKASAAELASTLQGAGACIFAASASPSGGSPQDVDKAGLVAVARACIAANVPRLVVVSSGSVSKPLSPVYIFLNLFGGIMRAKIEGEDAVRSLYFKRDGLDYVVVRPGGLTEDEPRGVGAIELNQGDDKSGRISRADVAAICVGSAIGANGCVGNATFECYWADSAKGLDAVGFSNMMGGTNADGDYVSGRERRGNTWNEIFAGLKADAPGVPQQGVGPSL